MGAQQRLDARQIGGVEHLVGDQRAPRTGGHADGELRDGGKRQPPGAGIELAVPPEKLRELHIGLRLPPSRKD